jgi:DNA-binding CsgD family transcriptional regulator
MDLFRHLLKKLGLIHPSESRKYTLDVSLQPMLDSLAGHEQLSPDEVASGLVNEALSRRQVDAELLRKWESLSLRQQQVAALICLGYTNRQISAKLGISIATVHTHSGHIQDVFDVNSKSDLRRLLAVWDFKDWDR